MQFNIDQSARVFLLSLALAAGNAFAQEEQIIPNGAVPATTTTTTTTPAPKPAQAFTQEQLDELLAPIALYPDALLSQILMAATYPLEIVEAARWSKANPSLQGDAAVQAVVNRNWDPSVKSLAAFPQVLATLDDKLDWTEQLGEAFLAQQADVMNTVQSLRAKAYAAGNLQSSDQQQVTQQGQTIVVAPYQPDVVYVPYYDPRVVYGTWWWATPPVYWDPFPAYYAPVSSGVVWGSGINVSLGFFFGAVDWSHRRVTVVHTDNYYYRPPVRPGVPPPPPPRVMNPGAWRHDEARRLEYHNEVVRKQYTPAFAPRPAPGMHNDHPSFAPRPPMNGGSHPSQFGGGHSQGGGGEHHGGGNGNRH